MTSSASSRAWTIGIDVGGTFTDLCAFDSASGQLLNHKRPSTPANPAEAILNGLSELCSKFDIAPKDVRRIAHGTTVATNALIQKRGGRVALIVTAGFRDLLEIGRQTRPKIYDFQTDHPSPLVPRALRFEANERVTRGGRVIKALEEAEIDRLVEEIKAADVQACAICFLFSHLRPEHELALASALRRSIKGLYVSASCEVQPEFREYERLSTTVLNAYLQPVMASYLARLSEGVSDFASDARLGINQSSGGLISAERAAAVPVRTALSGPAAGAAGAIEVASRAGIPDIITLDIGGTSSDIALIAGGRADMIHERWIEGYPARIPSIDINAVGAGGGSIAWIDTDGLLKVGPQSAGAVPGPACYNVGGTEPTVSDANLVLGRLSPAGLLNGSMPLRTDLARSAIERLSKRINLTIEQTALGILDIAVANMMRGIRTVSVERGYDPRNFTLFGFGGAGPLHTAAVAQSLGIRRILIPPHPGLLCAQGLIVSDQREHLVREARLNLEDNLVEKTKSILDELRHDADAWFAAEQIRPSDRICETSLDMRYQGQNFELEVRFSDLAVALASPETLRAAFASAHDRAYGFHNPKGAVELVAIRMALLGRHNASLSASEPQRSPGTAPSSHRPVWFERDGPIDTPIFRRESLMPGARISGPAIIDQLDTTTVVPPGWTVAIDSHLNIFMEMRQ